MSNQLAIPFSPENTLLVTNSLLQFSLVGILNIAFLITTIDNWTYTLAISSLFLMITAQILLPATYETSGKTKGLYFDSVERYNEPSIIACCFSLLLICYELIKQQCIISYIAIIILVNFIWKYLKQYIMEKTNTLPCADLNNDNSDMEIGSPTSDSLSELDNVNSDCHINNNLIMDNKVDEQVAEQIDEQIDEQMDEQVVEQVAEQMAEPVVEQVTGNKVFFVDYIEPSKNKSEAKKMYPNRNLLLSEYGYVISGTEELRRNALLDAAKDYDFELVIEKLKILLDYQAIPSYNEAMCCDIEYLEKNYLQGK